MLKFYFEFRVVDNFRINQNRRVYPAFNRKNVFEILSSNTRETLISPAQRVWCKNHVIQRQQGVVSIRWFWVEYIQPQSLCSEGKGSSSNTSNPAPAMMPAFNALTRAS